MQDSLDGAERSCLLDFGMDSEGSGRSGVHQDADEKSRSRAELLSTLRFPDSRNKIVRSPPQYILIWIRLLGGWPSIVNGGGRFALQA